MLMKSEFLAQCKIFIAWSIFGGKPAVQIWFNRFGSSSQEAESGNVRNS
ncbi:MAG: hypothetical protein Q4C96_03005 [Planctomycetia bacterium]|nr:hypothetical protein [Planctomycetia bacterium]